MTFAVSSALRPPIGSTLFSSRRRAVLRHGRKKQRARKSQFTTLKSRTQFVEKRRRQLDKPCRQLNLSRKRRANSHGHKRQQRQQAQRHAHHRHTTQTIRSICGKISLHTLRRNGRRWDGRFRVVKRNILDGLCRAPWPGTPLVPKAPSIRSPWFANSSRYHRVS